MVVRLATSQDRRSWDQFVSSSPSGSFLQSWAWGKFQHALGVPFWRLVAEHDGRPQAVALVIQRALLGRCWLYIPRGPHFALPDGRATRGKPVVPQTTWQALQDRLVDLARLQQAAFVTIDPSWIDEGGLVHRSFSEDGWRKAQREVQPRHTLVLDKIGRAHV